LELLTRDRNFLRQLEDIELIRRAYNDPTVELAIVLAERLEASSVEYEAEIEEQRERAAEFERQANQLDDKLYRADNEIMKLEWQIEELTKEIEEWRTK
jgi:predicted nuclease with TOPRIM domain